MRRKKWFGLTAVIAAVGMLFATPAMAETVHVSSERPLLLAEPDWSGAEAVGFTEEEWDVLYATNYYRQLYGLEPVSVFKELQDAAHVRVKELQTKLDHERPNGSSCFTALHEAGISYNAAGENIAAGQRDAAEVLNSWMNSEGHRANILDEDFTHLAAGHDYNSSTPYGDYWVQMFTGTCAPTSIHLLLDTDKTYLFESDKTMDEMGLVLEITCEHGTSYLQVTDEMCTYDKTRMEEYQDVTVTYRGLTTSFTIYVVEPMPFTDVPENAWYYNYVADVYYNGLMTGLNKTTFGPNQSLARAQFAVILYRIQGEPKVEYSPKFPDVGDGIWYTDAIMWASDAGIITGYSNTGKFGPADKINREQMAVMMFRYADYLGCDTDARADISGFADGYRVSGYAKEAMQWAYANGIITGKYNETYLEPQGNASRAECATIISRFIFDYLSSQE